MRRFTSGPKPARARAAVHPCDVRAVDAQPVTHAVVAREVRRRLGRGDEVVGGQAEHERGDGDLLDDRPRCGEHLRRARAPRRRRRGSASTRKSEMTPTRRPATPSSRWPRPARTRPSSDVESAGSWPAMTSSRRRGVGDGGGERTDLVERAREGDEPVTRHEAVGRLDPDHPAERRRLTDRTAGVRAERERHETRRDRGGAPPGGTTGHPVQVPRVVGRPEGGVLRRRAHRELVEVRLADDDRAGGRDVPGRRSRRTAAASPRGSATRPSSEPPGCTGCPSARSARRRAGPGRGPPPPRRRSASAATRAASPVTVLKQWSSPS